MEEYFTRKVILEDGTYNVRFYPEYINDKLLIKVVVNDWDELYMVRKDQHFVFNEISSLVIPYDMEKALSNCIIEYYQ